jgi:hypothetical protein
VLVAFVAFPSLFNQVLISFLFSLLFLGASWVRCNQLLELEFSYDEASVASQLMAWTFESVPNPGADAGWGFASLASEGGDTSE